MIRACFAHDRYIDSATAKCFSNLLALGFQKFEIDIYWDTSRQVWSLCPVQLGSSSSSSNYTAYGTFSSSHQTHGGLDVALDNNSSRDAHPQNDDTDTHVHRKQDEATNGSPLKATVPSLTGSSLATQTSTPTHSTEATPTPTGDIIHRGPYSCSPSTSFQGLVDILLGHIVDSQTNVNATIKYIIMNLHAAASASDPTGSPTAPPLGTLPQGKQALGYILDLSMAQYIYTPAELASQRSDLNSSQSWFAVERFDEPDSSYFVVRGNHGHTYTLDGWPSASFVEMQRAKRLFAGFGTIEPQMQQYNFSADKAIIFPAGYLQTPDGGNSCFFNPTVSSVSAVNNSWAQNIDESSSTQVFAAANKDTLCGISPILNKTLQGVTADQDYNPYAKFLQQAIWSWALGQPEHPTGDVDSNTNHRCAVLNVDSGFWETEDCSQSHHSACQTSGQPYEWSIGSQSLDYTLAELPCPSGTVFTAPRTALENQYLLHQWQKVRNDQNIHDALLWVNFNDLDVEGCWVVGQNVTCPYRKGNSSEQQVIVPTVAAVIVFAVAALTVFVKCAANRQQSKRRRRRRGDDGWDYEGVPS